jgi:hypothetical protein
MEKMNMAIKVYIVAGTGNTGKSSVTRHLTGLHSSRITELATIARNCIEAHVEISSLQEKGIRPHAFITKIKSIHKNFSAVVVTLRTDKKAKIRISADKYIDEFKKAGWDIKFVAELKGSVLSQHSKSNKYPYKTFQRASATNQLALQVRSFFQFI